MDRDVPLLRIVGEFAGEVLKKHYLVGNLHLDFEDYARFIVNKATSEQMEPLLRCAIEGQARQGPAVPHRFHHGGS